MSMFRLKAKTRKSSNYEAYQLMHNIYQQNKHNLINKDRIITDAIHVYDRINEAKSDYVINSFIKLCYNLRCYQQISSASTFWNDIELLTDTHKRKISFALLLICCIKSNNTDKSIKTLQWITKYEYNLRINESFIIRLIKSLNNTNELDYIYQIMSQNIINDGIATKTALIGQYWKTKNKDDLHKAIRIFNDTAPNQRDIIMNGAMMTALINHHHYNDALDIYTRINDGNKDYVCDALAIKACSAIHNTKQMKQIEAQISIDMNEEGIIPVQTALIDYYGDSGTIWSALSIFNTIRDELKNRVLINAMMTAYINNNYNVEALDLYDTYCKLEQDSIGHSLVLKACTNICDFKKGKGIIAKDIIVNDAHIQLKHTLINFYGDCGEIVNAANIFKSIGRNCDVVSINAMMTAYINNELYLDALRLYDMNDPHKIDNISHSLAIKSCSNICNFVKGKKIHSKLKKENKINDDIHIKTALIDLYGRSHDINNAEHIFKSIKVKNTVCYNAMMNVYCMNQKYDECLQLFECIEKRNCISYTIVFTVCANDDRVHCGNAIYNQFIESNLIMKDVSILSSLINMFASFGNLSECEKIFERVKSMEHIYLNKISIWNVMIKAYAINGDVDNAKRLFNQVREKTNITIDSKAYVTIFNAFSHGAHVSQAKYIWYNQILDKDIKYNMLVVSSFVDCLSRNRCLYEAYDTIYQYQKIKHCQASDEMWLSLLNGCKIYKNTLFLHYVVNEMKKIIY